MTPKAWIEGALRQFELGESSFASAHLDELGLSSREWREAARVLLTASQALPEGWTGRISLALPLLETPSLATSPPAEIRLLADTHEPPSLYLLSPGHLERHPTDGEEFHAWVPALGGIPVDSRLRCEFVSSRDAQAAERQWDFANTLWVHVVESESP